MCVCVYSYICSPFISLKYGSKAKIVCHKNDVVCSWKLASALHILFIFIMSFVRFMSFHELCAMCKCMFSFLTCSFEQIVKNSVGRRIPWIVSTILSSKWMRTNSNCGNIFANATAWLQVTRQEKPQQNPNVYTFTVRWMDFCSLNNSCRTCYESCYNSVAL